MPLNLPIALTWMRIAMIPLIVAIYAIPTDWVAMPLRDLAGAIAFVLAAITDWLDGWYCHWHCR